MLAFPRRASDHVGQLFPLARNHLAALFHEIGSGIPDLLAAMPQVHIEVTPLRVGDYDVGGDPCRVL